jgi:hypothetical protein
VVVGVGEGGVDEEEVVMNRDDDDDIIDLVDVVVRFSSRDNEFIVPSDSCCDAARSDEIGR